MERSSLDTVKQDPTQKTKVIAARTKPFERHIKIPTVSAFESDEDKEIAWLEYQLGIGTGKKAGRGGSTSYSKLLKGDGLDGIYLIDSSLPYI